MRFSVRAAAWSRFVLLYAMSTPMPSGLVSPSSGPRWRPRAEAPRSRSDRPARTGRRSGWMTRRRPSLQRSPRWSCASTRSVPRPQRNLDRVLVPVAVAVDILAREQDALLGLHELDRGLEDEGAHVAVSGEAARRLIHLLQLRAELTVPLPLGTPGLFSGGDLTAMFRAIRVRP